MDETGNGIIQTGNGIIQIGNGIISLTSRPLIKKLILQYVSHFHQGVHYIFSKQEVESSKQEMESLTSGPLIKKLLLQHLIHINQKMESSKQEMELFLPLPGL